MQIVLLKGWSVESVLYSRGFTKVVAIEGPWQEKEVGMGFICSQLFGDKSYELTTELIKKLRYHCSSFVSVDHSEDQESLVELEDLPTKRYLQDEIRRGFMTTPTVLDTWHIRELLPGHNRGTWMLPVWKHLVSDVPDTVEFNKNAAYRQVQLRNMQLLFDVVKDSIRLIQIQVRSSQEARRFMAKKSTLLALQVALICEHLKELEEVYRPAVVIEIPPWWSLEFKESLVLAVKNEFERV
jgi:hypothetical protein